MRPTSLEWYRAELFIKILKLFVTLLFFIIHSHFIFCRYYFIFESWNYFFVLSIAAATSSGSYLLTFVSNPVESFHEFGSQFPRVINFMM